MPRKIKEYLNDTTPHDSQLEPPVPLVEPRQQNFTATMLKLALVAVVAIFLVGILLGNTGVGENACIARIQLEGEISYEGTANMLGVASGGVTETISELRAAESDARVASVLMEINSPGGSASASKELFDQMRLSKKPIVTYVKDVAASGGYYAAAASDYIVANPNAVTGSIGARATLLNYGELFGKLGLREETIKSGELKDIGAGSRNMTDAERALLQELVNETAANFAYDVQQARKDHLDAAKFQTVLDARILSAKAALSAGLVDELGTVRVAQKKAAQLGGINVTDEGLDDLEYCDFAPKRGLIDVLTGASAQIGAQMARGFLSQTEKQGWELQYR